MTNPPIEDIRTRITEIVGIDHDEECPATDGKPCNGCFTSRVDGGAIDEVCLLFSSLLDELVMEERPDTYGYDAHYNIIARKQNQKIQSIQRAMKEETQ